MVHNYKFLDFQWIIVRFLNGLQLNASVKKGEEHRLQVRQGKEQLLTQFLNIYWGIVPLLHLKTMTHKWLVHRHGGHKMKLEKIVNISLRCICLQSSKVSKCVQFGVCCIDYLFLDAWTPTMHVFYKSFMGRKAYLNQRPHSTPCTCKHITLMWPNEYKYPNINLGQ